MVKDPKTRRTHFEKERVRTRNMLNLSMFQVMRSWRGANFAWDIVWNFLLQKLLNKRPIGHPMSYSNVPWPRVAGLALWQNRGHISFIFALSQTLFFLLYVRAKVEEVSLSDHPPQISKRLCSRASNFDKWWCPWIRNKPGTANSVRLVTLSLGGS